MDQPPIKQSSPFYLSSIDMFTLLLISPPQFPASLPPSLNFPPPSLPPSFPPYLPFAHLSSSLSPLDRHTTSYQARILSLYLSVINEPTLSPFSQHTAARQAGQDDLLPHHQPDDGTDTAAHSLIHQQPYRISFCVSFRQPLVQPYRIFFCLSFALSNPVFCGRR